MIRKLIALLALVSLTGCVGTFDEARLVRHATVTTKPSPDRCATLSDREYWFNVTSYGTGAAGIGAVITAIPASAKYDNALLVSGATAGAISVVTGFASQRAGTTYVKEGCDL